MKKALIAAVAVTLTAALAACGGSNQATAKPTGPLVIGGETIASKKLLQSAQGEGKLLIYEQSPEENWRVVLDAFTKDTGIEVQQIRLTSSELYERALTEFQAGKLPADTIGLTDTPLLDDLADKGVFTSYKVPTASSWTPKEKGKNDLWYGYMRLLMTPVYNTAVVTGDNVPTSWNDLLDSKWKGKLGLTPITAGGSSWAVYDFFREKIGADSWQSLADQDPKMYPSVVNLTQDIVRGETPIGVTNLGVSESQMKDGAPIKPLFLPEGIPAFLTGVGITKTAPHPDAAKVYMNWLLSKRGAEEMTKAVGEYAVRTDVSGPKLDGVDLPAPNDPRFFISNVGQWIKNRDTWTSQWQSTFKK